MPGEVPVVNFHASDEEHVHCPMLLLINEVYIGNVPGIIFIFLGLVDFCHIRSIGFNRVVKYSLHFKMKLYTVLLMVISEIIRVTLFIIFHVWWESHFGDQETEDICKQSVVHDSFYTVLNIVTAVAWFGAINLMIY